MADPGVITIMTRPGIYKHYKDGLYRVLFVCNNAANNSNSSSIVVYVDLKDGGIWCRDELEFNQRVYTESGTFGVPDRGDPLGKSESELTPYDYATTIPRFSFMRD